MSVKLAVFLLALACGTGVARAQDCVSYFDPSPGTCTGSNGCVGSYPRTSCIIGCISGTCNPNGNSTSCCGITHFYAQIFSDGGTCSGENCGLSRIQRASIAIKRFNNVAEPQLAQRPLYLPPRRLFVPNKCTHEYDVIYEWDRSVQKEGM